jgi:hypothetical protein
MNKNLINFKNKYIKYKEKYIKLKNQYGGSLDSNSPIIYFKIYYCNKSELIEITDVKLYELLSVLEEDDDIMLLKSNIQYYINNESESKHELLQNLKPISLDNIVLYKNEGCVPPKKPTLYGDTISSNNIYSFQLNFIEKKTTNLIPSRLTTGNETVQKHLRDDFREAKEKVLNGLHAIKDNHGLYIGYFKNDMKDGDGTYYFKNRATYNGKFKNNMMNGQGVLTEVFGEKYIGDFVDDKYEGHGKIVKPIVGPTIVDGKKVVSKLGEYIYYEGEFQNNMKHGFGIENYENKDKYEGQFINNRRNGHGILTFNNGNVYIGDFTNGKKNGNGIFKFKNGNTYNGEYINDKREGKGIFNFKNGDIYIGDFLNDKFHGNGKYTKADGTDYTGKFINNKFIKE